MSRSRAQIEKYLCPAGHLSSSLQTTWTQIAGHLPLQHEIACKEPGCELLGVIQQAGQEFRKTIGGEIVCENVQPVSQVDGQHVVDDWRRRGILREGKDGVERAHFSSMKHQENCIRELNSRNTTGWKRNNHNVGDRARGH